MSAAKSPPRSQITSYLYKHPYLFVLLIVAASIALSVALTLLVGVDIGTKTILLPAIISSLVGGVSVGYSRKYIEKTALLSSQVELLDRVADSLNFAVDIIKNPNDSAEVLGDQVHRFLGEPAESQLTFADLVDRIHPNDIEAFTVRNEEFFNSELQEDGVLTDELECRIRRVDGEYRCTRINRVLTVRVDTRFCYVQYSDIEELRQRAAELEKLAHDRADNLVTVSHEIRTPLNAILGLTDLMLATRLTKTQQEYLSKISGAADTLESLVRNLLDLRRLESGQLHVEPEPELVENLLDNFVALHQPVAENSGLRFMVDFSPMLPRKIEIDAQLLGQIVNNLLRNAVKFTDEGLVMLSAGFKKSSASQGDLVIEVSDTGVGIKPSRHESIFEQFERGGAGNTTEGAGLGLALVKRLCKLMDGEVRLQSELGVGSKFSISIPVKVSYAEPIVDKAYLKSIKRVTVLLVERRGLAADHIKAVLKPWVADVQVVVDLDEATGALAKQAFDVVLFGHVLGLDQLEQFINDLQRQFGNRLRLVAISKLEGLNPRLFSLVTGVVVAPFSLKQFACILGDTRQAGPLVAECHANLAAEVSSLILLRDLRILVAEDNEINQQVISEHLRQRGAEVTLVGDGKQAIDALTRSDYDLILMDIEMPVLDGFEATERIKAEPGWKNIPIIPVSAGVTASQKERATSVGMQGFVGKPYKIDELLRAIETVMVDKDFAPVQADLGFEDDSNLSSPESKVFEFAEFDFEEARDYWPTSESLISNLQLFIEKYPVANDLFDGVSDEESGKLAHTLKGAAGFLGMARYSNRLNELSLAFKNGSATADMVSDVRAQHKRVLSEVESFLSMLE
ncbi:MULTISPECIES: response regulator [unclassified Marinobacterium]|uniref:response regulator n=1 Tax=unclassified Marinobacterium TaxID=2644139 RepID=UPI00156976C9|nr:MULTISPECIES: response regulator [unclassified Marinobacterium]NRP10602.1 Signal transduction histidine-protein kinase BarA [Marinobacterium sp. xm-g-48]NRP57922.1 Signal transduction histidine-protein kinase BarA [Marinobacterium sp. xm-d-510]NRP83125.1 Signal transduction histidine-protein kinase BarA [Marinobacterium sp. xm-d-509]NRP94389.1 Signal transduction histidine-protein kinase BarA [Marinobacterium sp. xm-g-59]NRP97357.1 Signal transduction histidine-protein kinase BarA [Marinoba